MILLSGLLILYYILPSDLLYKQNTEIIAAPHLMSNLLHGNDIPNSYTIFTPIWEDKYVAIKYVNNMWY